MADGGAAAHGHAGHMFHAPTKTTSAKSWAISMKPIWMPAMAEPHCWSTNFAGMVSGKLARNMG